MRVNTGTGLSTRWIVIDIPYIIGNITTNKFGVESHDKGKDVAIGIFKTEREAYNCKTHYNKWHSGQISADVGVYEVKIQNLVIGVGFFIAGLLLPNVRADHPVDQSPQDTYRIMI